MNISRRRMFPHIGAGVAFAATSAEPVGAGLLAGTQEMTQEQWFDQLSKQPFGSLWLYRFPDEIYAITRQISWVPGQNAPKLKRVDVPAGFITDFASVPRIFWSVLPRDGKYAYSAVVHDYMYWTQDRPRDEADEIFRIGMEEFGVSVIEINAIYWAVRAAGGWAWDDNAKLRSLGEKRIITKFPTDPLVSWNKWKMDPIVFE